MTLFEPTQINQLTVPNRIVKSAMAEGACDENGYPTPALAKMYERWSAGGVGLAMTGLAHVLHGHSFTGREIGLYDDALVEPLREVTAAVHRHPGKIFIQLCHTDPQIPRSRARHLGSTSISAGLNRTNLMLDRELTDSELTGIARAFGDAGRRAREANFDGIQLHAAHGYLLSRSLSPRHNRRTDRWGGDFDRRLTLLGEVYRAIRAQVGRDYPVTVKLNAHDGQAGLTVEDGLRIARVLEEWGIDAVEVSAGTGDVGLGFYPNKGGMPVDLGTQFLKSQFPFLRPLSPAIGPFIRLASRTVALKEEAYFFPIARRFADALKVPVMCVGGVRSLEMATKIVQESRVAMVSLARPLVREPSLPNDWKAGKKTQAACDSCNRCFVSCGLGRPLKCYRFEEAAS